MSKIYKLTFTPLMWDCKVQVDADMIIEKLSTPEKPCTALDVMREQIVFFISGKYHLRRNNGDVVKTFLQMLGAEIALVVTTERVNLLGVIDYFKDREGWFDIDGSYGVKLLYTEDIEFDHEAIEVEEEAA